MREKSLVSVHWRSSFCSSLQSLFSNHLTVATVTGFGSDCRRAEPRHNDETERTGYRTSRLARELRVNSHPASTRISPDASGTTKPTPSARQHRP